MRRWTHCCLPVSFATSRAHEHQCTSAPVRQCAILLPSASLCMYLRPLLHHTPSQFNALHCQRITGSCVMHMRVSRLCKKLQKTRREGRALTAYTQKGRSITLLQLIVLQLIVLLCQVLGPVREGGPLPQPLALALGAQVQAVGATHFASHVPDSVFLARCLGQALD